MQALKPKQMAEGGMVTEADLPPIVPMPSLFRAPIYLQQTRSYRVCNLM